MFSQAGSRILAAGLIFRQVCPVLSLSQSGKAPKSFLSMGDVSYAGIRMVHLLKIIFNTNKHIILLLCNNEHDLLGLFR